MLLEDWRSVVDSFPDCIHVAAPQALETAEAAWNPSHATLSGLCRPAIGGTTCSMTGMLAGLSCPAGLMQARLKVLQLVVTHNT